MKRQPDFHTPPRLEAVKFRRAHTDNGESDAIQCNRPAHDAGITAEPPLPIAVADHCRRALPDAVVVRGESPAEDGLNAQCREEGPRNEFAVRAAGLPVVANVQFASVPGQRQYA